jgi:hypothetical protein
VGVTLQDWEQRRLGKSLMDSAGGRYFKDAAETEIIWKIETWLPLSILFEKKGITVEKAGGSCTSVEPQCERGFLSPECRSKANYSQDDNPCKADVAILLAKEYSRMLMLEAYKGPLISVRKPQSND